MKVRIVKRTSVVQLPIAEAFQVFSNPVSAERLMPAAMRFRLTNEMTEPIKAGTVLQYRFSFYRIPIRWRVRVESVEPPYSFAYVQLRGPFARWRHSQTFSAVDDQATEVLDRFEFVPPFGRIGEFAYYIFLRAKIRELFEYRSNRMDRVSTRGAPRPARAQADAEPKREPQSW